jgi:hypothetical protein
MKLSRYSRYSLAWLFVLALFVRSLIPLGYMPDFSGAAHFALVICDGVDHISNDGHPEDCPHHHHGGGTCPFSIGAIYTFNTVTIPVLPPVTFALDASAPEGSLIVEQPAVFAGSPRSPPDFS